MKRVKLTAIVTNDINKENFDWVVKGVGEVETYQESELPKDFDIMQEHSFEALWDSTLQFMNGLWNAAKGFFGMMKFAVIVTLEGIRWIWTRGVGSKDQKKKTKN